MQLPNKQPLMENVVITSLDELKDITLKALSQGSGAFLKVFAKDGQRKHYITLLFDKSKVLAAEALIIDSKEEVSGQRALDILRSLSGKPMVVDVYSLDEIELKISIADNVEIYAVTPKIKLEELLGKAGGKELHERLELPKESPRPIAQKIETEKKSTPPKSGHPEIIIKVRGGEIPEKAFQTYADQLLREAKRIRGLTINKIEFEANVGEGIAYLNVHIHGNSTESAGNIEIAEKRLLHAVSKYAPILLREAEIKPIIKDVSVVIDGQEMKPQEIADRDKKKTGNVTKDGKVTLSVLEDVWPYFSAYARTVINEIEGAGIKVKRAHFDVKGRREFEINLSLVAESSMPEDTVKKVSRDIVSRHAKELARSLKRYITVHTVEVEVISTKPLVSKEKTPKVASGKAAEVLAKKALIEKEVEELLKQAGIDELAPLTEEKKKEAEEAMLRSRIEPAIERLKTRVHAELKLIPRVTFKWLKLNHEIKNGKVSLDMEVSFLREETGGLFGSFSSVSDARVKKDIEETIKRVIRDVSKEYGVVMNLRKLNIILR